MTMPFVQLTPGQSHGEDEEFHDWMDGGFPHCALILRRIDCSVDCEITIKGREMRRKRRREDGSGRGVFDISCGLVRLLRLGVLPGKCGRREATAAIQTWLAWTAGLYAFLRVEMPSTMAKITLCH